VLWRSLLLLLLLCYRGFSSAVLQERTHTSVWWTRMRTGNKRYRPAHTVAIIAVYKPECHVTVWPLTTVITNSLIRINTHGFLIRPNINTQLQSFSLKFVQQYLIMTTTLRIWDCVSSKVCNDIYLIFGPERVPKGLQALWWFFFFILFLLLLSVSTKYLRVC